MDLCEVLTRGLAEVQAVVDDLGALLNERLDLLVGHQLRVKVNGKLTSCMSSTIRSRSHWRARGPTPSPSSRATGASLCGGDWEIELERIGQHHPRCRLRQVQAPKRLREDVRQTGQRPVPVAMFAIELASSMRCFAVKSPVRQMPEAPR